MSVLTHLQALRGLMQSQSLNAYIVPGTDPHASEYMAPHWMEMNWLSGFRGESGTMLVTMDAAYLWTDSRYYLQAAAELQGSSVLLMRESDVDCPSIPEWLCSHLPSGALVGVNAEMYSVNRYSFLQSELSAAGIGLISVDLIAPLWTTDRPPVPDSVLYEYAEQWAGESVESKLSRLRDSLRAKRCDALVIAELDEIGWLFNVRGKDVDYTPCVIAYAVVQMKQATLFLDEHKLDEAARAYLERIHVDVLPYTAIYDFLHTLSATAVMFDGNRVNEALRLALPCKGVNVSPSPLQVMMSVKNPVEMQGEREAMLLDAVALTRFFRWLEQEALASPQTEMTLSRRLHDLRAEGRYFMDESFCTIAAWQANGAIVHYQPADATCAPIQGNGVLLLDSGGQYLLGTTDITRTVWVGDDAAVPEGVKRDFTLVLKGHIALACARFPRGTRGNQLDVLAHQFMWHEGITYGHGTGHGVGHFMGCHEGPQNIRTDNNPNPLCLGNICSDEPGIYRAGEYGIRIENLIAVSSVDDLGVRSTGESYYQFETLTLCFYDTRLIDSAMLTVSERDWINAYHARVYREVAPLLSEEDAAYLRLKTRPIA